MNRFKTLVCAAALAALTTGTALASSVFTDNFDSENGGVSASPYSAFTNFDVTIGSVSLVHNGDNGVECVGGAGSCVNLGGQINGPINDNLQSKTPIGYNAGATVTLSYQISGNQRGCCSADDYFEGGFNLAGPTSLYHVTEDGQDEGTVAIASNRLLVGGGAPRSSNDPWRSHTISFVASEGGAVRAEFLSFSQDGVGPLLDNVSLTVTGGVPEPATWALMMIGLACVGAVLRRRAPQLALS